MDNILNHDVCSSILEFVDNQYMFTGTINKKCYSYYEKRSKTTRISSGFETLEKLKYSMYTSIPFEYCFNTPSIEVLVYLEENAIVYNINEALEHAIRRRDLRMIDYLESRYELHGPAVMIAAVQSGSLGLVQKYCADNVLDYEAFNFFPTGSHLCHLSSMDKRLVCDQWRVFVGDYLIEAVKENGDFEIMKWLYRNGIPSKGDGLNPVGIAAKHGNREMIQWMLDHGYPLSGSELLYVDVGEHQNYTNWLREIVNSGRYRH